MTNLEGVAVELRQQEAALRAETVQAARKVVDFWNASDEQELVRLPTELFDALVELQDVVYRLNNTVIDRAESEDAAIGH